jgi:hypothetical protein
VPGTCPTRKLGVDFLAVSRGDELSLVPLYDNSELHLSAGTIQPAVAVMAQLAPAAQAFIASPAR